MGILDALGLGKQRVDLLSAVPKLDGISGVFSDQSSLNTIVWSDLIGEDVLDSLPMSRLEAMSIPAVAKARNLIVATVSKWPLVARSFDRETRTDTDTTSEHPWLYRTNTAVSPYERMVWTLDDGIFYGCSLWIRENTTDAAVEGRKRIAFAQYCPFDWWRIDQGRILVSPDGDSAKERPVDADEVIFFNFPSEGLLNLATRTLRGARDLERSWVGKSRNPIPLINLKRTEDYQLGDEEAQALVDAYAAARTMPNGAIGSTPAGIDLEVFGEVNPQLMIEGRNAIRTDVGSFTNIRASMLDGTIGVDSLTYTTKEGERNAFFEIDLPFWTDPIEARLSLDDIVPRGQRIRFEKYESAPADDAPAGNTGPKVED